MRVLTLLIAGEFGLQRDAVWFPSHVDTLLEHVKFPFLSCTHREIKTFAKGAQIN